MKRIWIVAALAVWLVIENARAQSDGFSDIESWRTAHFPDGGAFSANWADPDGDGLVNLAEYALGRDPHRANRDELPGPVMQDGALVLAFNRRRPDVDYRVEISSNLSSWTSIGVDQGNPAPGEVEVSIAIEGGSAIFARLTLGISGEYVPLFDEHTVLEPATTVETDGALYTYFADRARDRHAREDQFQAYDHYLSFYWEERTAAIEIVDPIGKGGDTITFNVESLTEFKLGQAELRFLYRGIGTVAEYHDNGSMTKIDDTHYTRSISYNSKEGRPLQVGDRLEFELSQFLENPVNGRKNYYGTTYLYIVGEGLVPWEARGVFGDAATEREDSYPIPEEGWLGGKTTLPYMYSAEPDNHFMQMATNLSSINGQKFVLGRRVHHTDFADGSHDEVVDNPRFEELAGLLGRNYTNRSCVACHTRNGRALPPTDGELLTRHVVVVGDADGQPEPNLGRYLQSRSTEGDPEGTAALSHWFEENGLRRPVYEFAGPAPARHSVRIAPQLVGLGLLEAIPETALAALADPDDVDGDGISGRLSLVRDPETGDTRIGRFGWKASQPTLRAQAAAALNNDMGVTSSLFPEPDRGSAQPIDHQGVVELSEEHLENLVGYVSLLGIRPQRDLDDPTVMRGRELFAQARCVDCHTPQFQTSEFHPHAELRDQTIRPYTDLLLHDLGPGLADNLDAPNATGAEWRTPPLWGIGLTQGVSGGEGYLHDGRARTLDEAIRWHGGEGAASRDLYESMTADEKAALMAFLRSL